MTELLEAVDEELSRLIAKCASHDRCLEEEGRRVVYDSPARDEGGELT